MKNMSKSDFITFIGIPVIIIELLTLIGIHTIRAQAQPIDITEAPPVMETETQIINEVETAAVPEFLLELEAETTAAPETEAETEAETLYEKPAETYLGVFKTTAYCGCRVCCGKNAKMGADGEWLAITRTGVRAQKNHTISVDPDVIPLGSKVRIGDTIYTAEDTGGRWIQGNHIDIYMGDHDVAKLYGVQSADVWLINQ